MDGVIAEFRYKDSIKLENFLEKGVFRHRRPVLDIITILDPQLYDIYIMSSIPSSRAAMEKMAWLKDYNIETEEVFFISPGFKKSDFIKTIAEEKGWDLSQTYMLDDTHKILLECEEEGINAIHPTTFLINKGKI